MHNTRTDNGTFIVFEGIECCGKTTQIKLFVDFLNKNNIRSAQTREPGGTDLAEKIREMVKHHEGPEVISPRAEILLFNAARSLHVENKIRPALESGTTVICDRYYYSTIAFQGGGRGLGVKTAEKLCRYAINGCEPDLVFYLKVSLDTMMSRKYYRDNSGSSRYDRIEASGLEFYQKVYDGYNEVFKNMDTAIIIDAEKDVDNVYKQLVSAYNQFKSGKLKR